MEEINFLLKHVTFTFIPILIFNFMIFSFSSHTEYVKRKSIVLYYNLISFLQNSVIFMGIIIIIIIFYLCSR